MLGVCAVLAAFGVAGTVPVLKERGAYEAAVRGPVEITMDWESLRAAVEQRWEDGPAGVGAALGELKRAGLTSLAVAEVTAGRLAEEGRAVLLSPAQMAVLGIETPEEGPVTVLEPPPTPTAERAGQAFTASTWLLRSGEAPLGFRQALPAARPIGLGLDPEGVRAAGDAGLPVLMRYGARPRVEPLLDPGPERPAMLSRVTVFEGDRLPALDETLPPMQRTGLALGLVEFARQAGAEELARKAEFSAVVVHSMKAEEIDASTVEAVVERYVRAVRERGATVLYLRPAASYEATAGVVSRLRADLESSGYRVGLASARPVKPAPAPWPLFLMGLGVAGITGWAVAGWAEMSLRPEAFRRAAVPLSAFTLAGGAGLGALLAAAASPGWSDPPAVLARQAVALLAALATPVAATAGAFRVSAGSGRERGAGDGRALWRVPAAFAVFVGVTLAGGAMVAAMLSDSAFMLRVEQFRGVKLAHALPVLAVGLAALFAVGIGWTGLVAGLRRPIRWVDAAAVLVVLAGAAYYLLRTGNESAPVLPVERHIREWLESGMVVRPRTKEWLFGYPALALMVASAWSGWAGARGTPGGACWRGALLATLAAAASVASISVVNSFSHIHTPLAITMQRVLNGLVLGAVTGAGAWLAAWLVLRRRHSGTWRGSSGREAGHVRETSAAEGRP